MAEHALEQQDEDQGLMARWRQTEPLRLWLYGIAVPLLTALVGYALLTGHQAGLWLAVLQAALLGGGTEVARQYVVAPATARAAAFDAALETSAPGVPGGDPAAAERATRLVAIHYRIPS